MGVGLDIGNKTIKIVEVSHDRGGYRLRASGIAGYVGSTPDTAQNDKDLVPLVEALKKLVKESKISTRDVSIALPESQVYSRSVRLPELTDSEISSAIKWEAEQYVPIPAKEAIIQHEILERKSDVSPPYVSVLIVAAGRELIKRYSRIVEMAGLRLVGIETEMLAIARSLASEDQTSLIVDLGALTTDIAVVKKGKLFLSRSVTIGGDAFTRAVSQYLGIDSGQAEEYKRTYGMSGTMLEGKVKEALDPVFRSITDELKKSIHYYQGEEKGDSPKSIILSGGTSGIPEIASILTKVVGIEVVIGNPFSKIVVEPSVIASIAPYAPFYSIAVGLAMKEV